MPKKIKTKGVDQIHAEKIRLNNILPMCSVADSFIHPNSVIQFRRDHNTSATMTTTTSYCKWRCVFVCVCVCVCVCVGRPGGLVVRSSVLGH